MSPVGDTRRLRPVAFLALVGVATLSAALALVLRLAPTEDAVRKGDARTLAAVSAALELDGARLASVSRSIRSSPGFVEIVEGGGSELRPERLFGVLARGLPGGQGWGILFADPGGRAVAWAGEAPPAEAALSPGTRTSFQVTTFSLVHAVKVSSSGLARGTLVVGRRYPTGMVRPDLAEALAVHLVPPYSSVRAAAAISRGALVRLGIEPGPGPESAEAVARSCALFPAILAAASLLALCRTSVSPVLCLVGARLVLLLGTPIAPAGIWQPLAEGEGASWPVLSTPGDILLTAIVVLAVARRAAAPTVPRPAVLGVASTLAGAVFSLIPFLGVRALEAGGTSLPDGVGLLPASWPEAFVRVGLGALAAGAFALGVRLLPSAAGKWQRLLAVVVGVAFLVLADISRGTPPAVVLGVAGSILGAIGLARNPERDGRGGIFARSAAACVVAGLATLAASAGLADATVRRLDALLATTDPAAPRRVERDREADELPSRFEERLLAPGVGPWLPAGEATVVSDAARAVFGRGAEPAFPRAEDVLTFRDGEGRVVSSFGQTRPGRGRPATTFRLDSPFPALSLWVTRDTFPRLSDRDPLLAAVAERDGGYRPLVERTDFDAAGRPTGGRAGERGDLPAGLLAEVRRRGVAKGDAVVSGVPARIRVRAAGANLLSLATAGESSAAAFFRCSVAAEGALPLVVFFLVGPLPVSSKREAFRALRGMARSSTFRGRLMGLLFLAGTLPLAAGVVAVRATLERESDDRARRRALSVLSEARRLLDEELGDAAPDERSLNSAASVLGVDLLLFREGSLVAASRALPVAAMTAPDRLQPVLAARLAEGQGMAAATAAAPGGGGRVALAALALTRGGREAISVVLPEDEAGQRAVDGLVLLAIAAAITSVLAAGRAAERLSRPVEEVADAAVRIGRGESGGPIARPVDADLARLVDAFVVMDGQVRERTAGLARERAAAIGLLASLTAAVILFREEDGAVLVANPAAATLIPGGDLGERLAAPEWAVLGEFVESRRKKERSETRISVGPPGGERVFRVALEPIGGEGEDRRCVLVLEDLTDFVKADRLTAWIDAARAIAHDIRNPLTPVQLAADRLARFGARNEPVPPGTALSLAETVTRQVVALAERIGRLRRLSADASSASESVDPESLRKILAEVASDFGVPGHVDVSVAVADGLPAVRCSREILADALSNFLVNALEAAPGRALRLHLEATHGSGGEVVVSCEDDGPGLADHFFPRLFEPAFTTKTRGSGMGLFVTRRSVESLGGRVFAERRDSGGLRVGIVLRPA